MKSIKSKMQEIGRAAHSHFDESVFAGSFHTPGPWRVGDAGNTVFGPPNGNPAPEVVANVRGGTSDQAAVTRALRMEANARLISAAPDLLEASKEAERVLSLHYNDMAGVLTSLRCAILKAEGRKP